MIAWMYIGFVFLFYRSFSVSSRGMESMQVRIGVINWLMIVVLLDIVLSIVVVFLYFLCLVS